MVPADLRRIQAQIAEKQGIFDWADEHLLASPGALVLRQGKAVRVPTLVPARRSDGACTFFTDDNLCAIHSAAPFGCAFFDNHLRSDEADRRSSRGLQAIMESWQSGALYAQVWKHLYAQGLWALAPEVARRRMDRDDRSTARPEHDTRVKKDIPTADLVELLRRLRLAEINFAPADRPVLESRHGKGLGHKRAGRGV